MPARRRGRWRWPGEMERVKFQYPGGVGGETPQSAARGCAAAVAASEVTLTKCAFNPYLQAACAAADDDIYSFIAECTVSLAKNGTLSAEGEKRIACFCESFWYVTRTGDPELLIGVFQRFVNELWLSGDAT